VRGTVFTANDAVRNEGEDNPAFALSYPDDLYIQSVNPVEKVEIYNQSGVCILADETFMLLFIVFSV
jgi:hypothetical protein